MQTTLRPWLASPLRHITTTRRALVLALRCAAVGLAVGLAVGPTVGQAQGRVIVPLCPVPCNRGDCPVPRDRCANRSASPRIEHTSTQVRVKLADRVLR